MVDVVAGAVHATSAIFYHVAQTSQRGAATGRYDRSVRPAV